MQRLQLVLQEVPPLPPLPWLLRLIAVSLTDDENRKPRARMLAAFFVSWLHS